MTNDNSGAPRLERELKASVAWAAWQGRPVADAMGDVDRERTVAEEREQRTTRTA